VNKTHICSHTEETHLISSKNMIFENESLGNFLPLFMFLKHYKTVWMLFILRGDTNMKHYFPLHFLKDMFLNNNVVYIFSLIKCKHKINCLLFQLCDKKNFCLFKLILHSAFVIIKYIDHHQDNQRRQWLQYLLNYMVLLSNTGWHKHQHQTTVKSLNTMGTKFHGLNMMSMFVDT